MRSDRALSTAALATLVLAAAVPARAQFRAGPEFRVNTYTTDHQSLPPIAFEREGEFVVVWSSYLQDGSGSGVFGQAFRDDGSPRGTEFRANSYTTSHQVAASVAHDGNEFVVVWTSFTQDGSGQGVVARRFRKDGTPASGEILVNTVTTGDQQATAVAKDRRGGSRGGFVVVWTDYSQDTGNIKARRYDETGAPVTGEILVNTYTTSRQADGQVAMADDGRFVVVWTSDNQDGSLDGVFGRQFAADGTPLGVEFQVNSASAGEQYRGPVAMAGDGRFIVSFAQSDGSGWGIFARRFDANGAAIGVEFQVNTYTTDYQTSPSIAANRRGDFVVTWPSYMQDGSLLGVFGQRFDKNAVRLGTEFQVNAYTTNAQGTPRVAMDEVGNFNVAWSSLGQDGSGFGVYGQRFGGILFPAIGLDQSPTLGPVLAPQASDGNGVLEPGETVVVQTTWKNVSGFAQTVNGVVRSFTGPAGATYSVPDPNASFGTIPIGGTQSCAVTGDCYAVTVSGGGPRPVTHWDAVMEEGVVSIILGQAKLWALHVGDSFTDVPRTSPFYKFIETLLHYRITGGCTATEYCPATTTTRDQMAVFVVAAASGPLFVPPACGVPMFADVPPTSPFCPFVEELARRGVVAGCGPALYCPTAAVTREQMAVFVLRGQDAAANPPACGTPMFADVPASSLFCRWIEELARRGVVSGCGGGNYCPAAPVTREQMGVFISGTFGLALYGV